MQGEASLQRAGSVRAGSLHTFYQDEEAELQVSTESANTITTLLSSLILKNEKATDGPIAWCSVSEEGLVFSVQLANTMRASARLSRALFTEWRLSDEAGSQGFGFGVNLGTLVECLRILSGKDENTLRISYNAASTKLRLTLVEGGAVTECDLGTLDTEEILPVTEEGCTARIVLESSLLTEALSDFQFSADEKNQRLRLRTGLQPPQLAQNAQPLAALSAGLDAGRGEVAVRAARGSSRSADRRSASRCSPSLPESSPACGGH